MRKAVPSLCILLVAVLTAASAAAAQPKKFLWAELIAFDNTKADFGVEEYLSRMQMKPDAVSLLLIEASLFERHTAGLPSDFRLPAKACSYLARPYNVEHERQDWSAFQLRGLVAELNRREIETYASFFEWGYQDLTGLSPKGDEPYVDLFIRQTCAFLKDYGFTGLHAADGFAHPRKNLVQRKLPVSRRFAEAEKWGAFWKKASAAFHAAGFKTYLNTCWTRDPYEALVRYGYDYRMVSDSDIDGWVVEASSACLELEGWNKTEESSLDKTAAMLMRLTPTLRGKETVLMFGVKDDCEQFHSLYHAQTQAEAEAAIAGTSLLNGRRALCGVLACLSDGLTQGEWTQLDRMWRHSFSGDPAGPLGVSVVWSERAFERECRELPESGEAGSGTLLSALLHRGAVIGGTIGVAEALKDESIPVLVLNPACFPPDELAALERRGSKLVKFGLGQDEFVDHPVAEDPATWLDPLKESRPGPAAFDAARSAVNEFAPVVPADGFEDIVVGGFMTGDGAWHVMARNNRRSYVNAQLRIRRPFGRVEILSAYPSVPVEPFLHAKIPPMGVVLLSVQQIVGTSLSGGVR